MGMGDCKCYLCTEVTSHWSPHCLKPHLDLDKVAADFGSHLCGADEVREVMYLNDLTI